MKAILLAAGMGTRLGVYTKNKPKCMLPFLGKPLLARQVETLHACNITDITVITGYLRNKVRLPGIKRTVNSNYQRTNMTASLFVAESELSGDVLVVYTDILYEPRLITAAQASRHDIAVVVDDDYEEYWQNRLADPSTDRESLVVGPDEKILSIGTSPCSPEEARERYIGIIKLSATGVEIFKEVYNKNKQLFGDKEIPWFGSPSFAKGYLTSFIQAIITDGYPVHAVRVKRGWLEFDTISDYTLYTDWAKYNTLSRFFNDKHTNNI